VAPIDSAFYSAEQFLVADRLLKELDRASGQRSALQCGIQMACEEQDRDCAIAQIEVSLELNARQTRHVDVKQKTIGDFLVCTEVVE
jgi:hypothetical protein